MEFGRPRANLLRAAVKAQGFNIGLNLGGVRGRGCARSLAHPHRATLDRRHELHADHWWCARALGRFARLIRQIDGSAGEDGFATLKR